MSVPNSVSTLVREGRGSKTPKLTLSGDERFRAPYKLVSCACSASTNSNIKLALKVIADYAKIKQAPGPIGVTLSSSTFVLNLLADYCEFGEPDSLKNDAINALIQGVRNFYSQNGDSRTWFVDETNSKARGNPLKTNPELNALRRSHGVHLAHYSVVTLHSQPMTVEQVCDHAKRYWYSSQQQSVNIRDVLLHSIMVISLEFGLRYDEVSKLKVENVSVGSGGCTLIINESV